MDGSGFAIGLSCGFGAGMGSGIGAGIAAGRKKARAEIIEHFAINNFKVVDDRNIAIPVEALLDEIIDPPQAVAAHRGLIVGILIGLIALVGLLLFFFLR